MLSSKIKKISKFLNLRYVHQLLEQYTRFSTLMRDAFANDARFLTIRDQAFREVVNNTDVFRLELGGNGGGKRFF